jgi:hypothetical protein
MRMQRYIENWNFEAGQYSGQLAISVTLSLSMKFYGTVSLQ